MRRNTKKTYTEDEYKHELRAARKNYIDNYYWYTVDKPEPVINGMTYEEYNNLEPYEKEEMRLMMTTDPGYGHRKVGRLSFNNRKKERKGRSYISRHREPLILPRIPTMRYKPERGQDKKASVSNKIFSLLNYVDNVYESSPRLYKKIEELTARILNFVGSDKYFIEFTYTDLLLKKHRLSMPVTQEGLTETVYWILGLTIDDSDYGASTLEFGDYDQIKKLNMTTRIIDITPQKKTKRVQFLPYINKKDYDLKKLQIYRTVEEAEEHYKEHCFVNSCRELGIKEGTLIRLKYKLKKRPVLIRDLQGLCKMLKRNIGIKNFDGDETDKANTRKTYKEPDNEDIKKEADKHPRLEFVRYKGHIMPEIEFNISTYSVKNYEDVKNMKDFHLIFEFNKAKGVYTRRKAAKCKTSTLIKALIDTESFEYSYEMSKVHKNIDLSTSEISSELWAEQMPYEQPHVKDVYFQNIFYADLESLITDYTNSDGEISTNHRNFMAGYVAHQEDKPYIFRCKSKEEVNKQKALYDMFNHIADRKPAFTIESCRDKDGNVKYNEDGTTKTRIKNYPFVVYFHNLKYDFTFIRGLKLKFKSICEKSGALYSVSFSHRGKDFILKDSWKLLQYPLSAFKNNLNLDVGKAPFEMYDYFTEENLNNDNEITYQGHIIKPVTHYIKYLELDCLTLKAGLIKLYETLKEFDSFINIYRYLTISSMAFAYFGHCGCWEGLYSLSGSVLNFVNMSSVGGRCCSKDNKKIAVNLTDDEKDYVEAGDNFNKDDILFIYKMLMEDFDMKSCYPSSFKISKLPLGPASLLFWKDINAMNKYYRYLLNGWKTINPFDHVVHEVEIKFTGYVQIPILSVKDKQSGARIWSNEINEPLIISSVYLEDIIKTKYYNIESIKVIRGVYWEQGFNTKCQEHIQRLYDERLKYKTKGPYYSKAMSESIKLILNSIYGKCGVKAAETKIKIVSSKDLTNFRINNYEDMVYEKQLNDYNHEVKVRVNTYHHSNFCHISSLILENSKVLMNHVIKAAENVDCTILYTDTDSFHIEKYKIPELSIEYNKLFNKTLIGNQLTQFSVDFDPAYVDGKEYLQHSVKFINPGLKWYYDELKYTLEDGTESKISNEHIRTKGCDKENVKAYIKKNNMTIPELYLSFLRGDTHKIDLCKGKVRFEFKNFNVNCREVMLKEFKF